jgi:hypothetical protein
MFQREPSTLMFRLEHLCIQSRLLSRSEYCFRIIDLLLSLPIIAEL